MDTAYQHPETYETNRPRGRPARRWRDELRLATAIYRVFIMSSIQTKGYEDYVFRDRYVHDPYSGHTRRIVVNNTKFSLIVLPTVTCRHPDQTKRMLRERHVFTFSVVLCVFGVGNDRQVLRRLFLCILV